MFAEGTRRRHSSGTRVDVFQSEKGDAVLWTRLSYLRLMQPDLKDFRRSLNVKSSLTIGKPGHPLFPEAVVHALVPHWTQALMPFNAKPALAV